jgi:hypothetical protein
MLFVSVFPRPRRFGANDDIIDDITECSLVAFFMAYVFWRGSCFILKDCQKHSRIQAKKGA